MDQARCNVPNAIWFVALDKICNRTVLYYVEHTDLSSRTYQTHVEDWR
jgi:hypothetical protein